MKDTTYKKIKLPKSLIQQTGRQHWLNLALLFAITAGLYTLLQFQPVSTVYIAQPYTIKENSIQIDFSDTDEETNKHQPTKTHTIDLSVFHLSSIVLGNKPSITLTHADQSFYITPNTKNPTLLNINKRQAIVRYYHQIHTYTMHSHKQSGASGNDIIVSSHSHTEDINTYQNLLSDYVSTLEQTANKDQNR